MEELEAEFVRILRAFQNSGALAKVVLVGSWALFLYGKTILEGKISTY